MENRKKIFYFYSYKCSKQISLIWVQPDNCSSETGNLLHPPSTTHPSPTFKIAKEVKQEEHPENSLVFNILPLPGLGGILENHVYAIIWKPAFPSLPSLLWQELKTKNLGSWLAQWKVSGLNPRASPLLPMPATFSNGTGRVLLALLPG